MTLRERKTAAAFSGAAVYPGRLSIRQAGDGSRVLAGNFPYGQTATLSDGGRNGGRPVKERFAANAFEYRVADETAEIHLLVGHDFNMPLASKLTDTLTLKDSAAGLSFEASISPEIANTRHGADILAMIGAGLAVGISPGFRIPPQGTVPNAETVEDEPESEGRAIIRTINAALLYELSIVTRPAYADATVEARELAEHYRNVAEGPAVPANMPAAWRWR